MCIQPVFPKEQACKDTACEEKISSAETRLRDKCARNLQEKENSRAEKDTVFTAYVLKEASVQV